MSKEYIVATVYHEILHAYLIATCPVDAEGKFLLPLGNGHNNMANKYITLLTGALKIAFPDISDQQA
jgi:hypothetical protein